MGTRKENKNYLSNDEVKDLYLQHQQKVGIVQSDGGYQFDYPNEMEVVLSVKDTNETEGE